MSNITPDSVSPPLETEPTPLVDVSLLSPEEKDRHWYRNVYQGDHQPQLTWRAVLTGGFLGMFLSLSNLYTTLKLGWAFGVAITASVMAFVLWRGLRVISGGKLSQMSLLETNCMQSTASAAGYSTGGTVGSALAALYLVNHAHEPLWVVVGFVFLTAVLGVFLAIPMKRQMINHEQLPFPSGIAAAETLRSLYSEGKEAMQKAWTLLLGMGVGLAVGISKGFDTMRSSLKEGSFFHVMSEKAHSLYLTLPEMLSFPRMALPGAVGGAKLNGFGFEPGIMMIGAGMIMGLRVSLSMLAGSVVLYCFLTPWLVEHDVAAAAANYNQAMWKPGAEVITPFRWGVWTGTALMVFSSLTGLALQWKTVAKAFSIFNKKSAIPTDEDRRMAAIEVPGRWLLLGLIPTTLGLVALMFCAWKINPLLAVVSVGLSFVLSLVASRATGETDTTPIGAMGKVTQLLFAALSPANKVINLTTAGTTSAAAGSCADLLTDLKSGYLLGANPRRQFLAQFAGIFFGVLAIVPAWFLLIQKPADLEKFALPAAQSWKAMADLLESGPQNLNFGALQGIIIGSLLGILLPILEMFAPRARRFLPSAMGLGLGFVVSFANSFSFTIGALIAWIWSKRNEQQANRYNVPLASGFVAGEGLIGALVAILMAVLGLMGKG